MLVSLYTVRIVLETLGVEDYGIYNVIFGMVAMLGFLNGTLSTAMSRFMAYELGSGNTNRLKNIFEAARTINLIVSVIVILIGETIGLWFLLHKLVIPPDRVNIAIIIYQIAIVSFVLQLRQMPYIAAIMAHEHMNIFAKYEIINAVLKLLAVCLLPIIMYDKLLVYGILLLCISIIINICYKSYCIRNFKESKSGLCTKSEFIKPLLSYSGLDLYGNLSVVMRMQGINILLNLFFGPVLNAASGFANQMQSIVGSFANNLLTAFRPQITICYANNNKEIMSKYIRYAAKYGFLLLLAINLPLYLEMEFILSIWLTKVPNYTVDFCKITLLFVMFASFSNALVSGLHAAGKIKIPSLLNGSIYLSVIPITYFLFKMGYPPIVPFILNAIFVIFGATSNLIALRYHVNEFSIKYFLKTVVMPCITITIVSSVIPILSVYFMSSGFLRLFIITLASLIIIPVSTYFLGAEREVKDFILRKISILMKCKN
jgi:O-antigen/teichoic acid export membrane protein